MFNRNVLLANNFYFSWLQPNVFQLFKWPLSVVKINVFLLNFTTDDGHLNGRNAFDCNQLKCIKVVG
jgi:hypothetical protein